MKVFSCAHLPLPLPPCHRFPARKYPLLRRAVVESGLLAPEQLHIPEPATDEQLLLVHEPHYVERVKQGSLSVREVRRLGLPWSAELVARARCSVGGTIAACRAALQEGMAIHLAGGTHHAFYDHGEGYCLFNDTVVAARSMQAEGRVQRVVVLDCDVHQGNGTAALTAGDPSIFTFSIHGERNFPLRKQRSDLDIGLEDGTGDEAYLEALDAGVQIALERARADLVIYLAGADPYEEDMLGRLALSKAGLAARDRLVLDHCRQAELPVAVTLAGGYARHIEDAVDIHLQTVRITLAFEDRSHLWRDR